MATRKFVLISFDTTQLLLPQESVGTIEAVSELGEKLDFDYSFGTLKTTGFEWPVFALNRQFQFFNERPSIYKYCVGINESNTASFAIACEEVNSVTVEDESELKPVQACMRLPANPVESLLLRDNRLMMVSSAETMRQYFIPEVPAA